MHHESIDSVANIATFVESFPFVPFTGGEPYDSESGARDARTMAADSKTARRIY